MNDLMSRVHDGVTRPGSRSRPALLAAAAAAALLALAACSSSSSASSSAAASSAAASSAAASSPASAVSPSSVSPSSASSVLGQSAALLGQAAADAVTGPSFGIVPSGQIARWTASLMPAPSKLATGRPISVDVVYGIPVGYTPYAAHVIAAVGAKLGWKVKVIQASAPVQPAELVAMQQAVLDRPTAIIGVVVPGSWVGPALTSAKAAGIFTVDLHQDTTDGAGYTAYVPDAEGVQKELLAAYAISQSKGSAKTMLVSAPAFSDVNVPAAQTYLSACSTCNTQLVQFNSNDFTNPVAVQSDITAKLSAVSGVTYIVWPDGALPIQTVITAISSSISSKSTKLIVNDAAPGSVQLLQSGAIPVVVYAPAAMTSLVAIDDINRLVLKQQPLAETALRFPVSYWTTRNSPAPGYPAITGAQLKQADWLSPYEQAWGAQLKSVILGVSG